MLVLSDRAGAANEMTDALLVNPYDIRGIARALKQALDMPLAERRARHERLLGSLREHDLEHWSNSFTAALQAAGQQRRAPAHDDQPNILMDPLIQAPRLNG